jgi:hypothetical protein
MKTLKFRETLAKQILKGEKNSTWRFFDEKNISVGDDVSLLVWETKEEFAKAKVISVEEKKLCDLNEEDWKGHERFSSDEEMLRTFSDYYKREITKDTLVKVVKFKLLIDHII